MRVRLIRKLANILDGIDVSGYAVGDVLTLPRAQAQLLIAEQWAARLTRASKNALRGLSAAQPRAAAQPRTVAADRFRRARATSAVERLRVIHDQITSGQFEPHQNRRAEDRIREERRDSHARTTRRVR